MTNVVEIVAYIVFFGLLLGILLDEKDRKLSFFFILLFIAYIVVEIAKEISVTGYGENYILITIVYLALFISSIAFGAISNKKIKEIEIRKLERVYEGKNEKN